MVVWRDAEHECFTGGPACLPETKPWMESTGREVLGAPRGLGEKTGSGCGQNAITVFRAMGTGGDVYGFGPASGAIAEAGVHEAYVAAVTDWRQGLDSPEQNDERNSELKINEISFDRFGRRGL